MFPVLDVEDSIAVQSKLTDIICNDHVLSSTSTAATTTTAAIVTDLWSFSNVFPDSHRHCCHRYSLPKREFDIELESSRRSMRRNPSNACVERRSTSSPSTEQHRSPRNISTSDFDLTITALLWLCALCLSIHGARGAATGRQRNRQDAYSGGRQGQITAGSAAAAAASQVPDYDYYEYLLSRSSGQDRNTGRSHPYNYGTDVGGPEAAKDAGRGDSALPPKPPPIKCYSCDYVNDWNHGQGLTSCLDPFVKDNIPPVPTVDCDGPCGKIFRKLEGKDDYILSRNCVPNCKEQMRSSEKGSYTECCSHSFCNRAIGGRTLSRSFKLVFIICVAISTFSACILRASY